MPPPADRRTRFAVALGAALAVVPTVALADRIDGEWCRESRHFAIEGPNILTWGGTRMQGDYSRHGFRYTIPAGEPDAGTDVEMHLLGEELVEVVKRSGGQAAPTETWRRCKVTS